MPFKPSVESTWQSQRRRRRQQTRRIFRIFFCSSCTSLSASCSPNIIFYFGGYMLAFLCARSFAHTHTLRLLIESSLFFSFSLVFAYCAAHICSFPFLTHFNASLSSSKLLECKIRLHAYAEKK